MYTQCPHCQTCFRISEAHLKVAKGKVRCGSCQEVFDATQNLFKNLTDREPITDYKQSPEKSPASTSVSPTGAQHIELSTAPTPAPNPADNILREREKVPDQSRFMESTIANDRYNDLDQMGPIKIPGEINFDDSFIKFPEQEPEKPAPEPESSSRTLYEDIESNEAAATTADHDTIKDFYAQVDKQLSGDETKSQLDKDIDELMAFAKGLDRDTELEKPKPTPPEQPTQETIPPTPSGIEVEEEFDLKAIAEFEKELATSSTGVFEAQQSQQDELSTFVGDDLAKSAESAAPAEEEDQTTHIEIGEQTLPDEQTTPAKTDESKSSESVDVVLEELPSPSQNDDIPLALRRSLDNLNAKPQRSIWKTLMLLVVILILIGGLGFQTVLFRNVELANTFPSLIPILSEACDRLPCRYSGKIDVSQIKLLSRDVRSDPNQANALLISAAFVNQAPFDQPYPILQITLYDLGGNVVASRRFTPQEYLGEMYNRFLLMESGTPVHVILAVLDPGNDAINFEFSFM